MTDNKKRQCDKQKIKQRLTPGKVEPYFVDRQRAGPVFLRYEFSNLNRCIPLTWILELNYSVQEPRDIGLSLICPL